MTQYINFYKNNKPKIDEGCAPLLNAAREEAFGVFCKEGFPAYRSEDYRHTDVAALLNPDYGFFIGFAGEKIDPYRVFKCNLVNLTSFVHFTINGHFYDKDLGGHLPEGVFSGSMNVFARQYPELFTRHYNKLAGKHKDGLSAFNTMFVQDGYVLYVPANTVVEKPIQLTNVFNTTIDALVNRRILIILEKNAQAKLLVCDHSMNEKPRVAGTQVSELFIGENATFDFYELEESSRNTVRLTETFVKQESSSNLIAGGITLSNGTTRNNYRVDLDGENADMKLYGMATADRQQRVDNYSLINHNVPHCTSDELFKYILDEEATGAFAGKIVVAQDAQKTQAYQHNRNMLNGNACRMFSKPQLEIYADDVKCSHGMTTGQLDENALFYMRQRGIPEAEAKILLQFAFADDVIKGIRIETMRERLRMLVDKRFRGEPIKCQGCI